MIIDIASTNLAVHENLKIQKNRLCPDNLSGNEKRFSIVTGIHGDELDGQYICYEIIRRINENKDKLTGIVDVYPSINPLGIDTGIRGIPMFDLDMNRVFPGSENGAMAEYVAAMVVGDIIGSDMCIDLHSSNVFIKEIPQVRVDEENADSLLPYAMMLNTDLVWVSASMTVLNATLAYSLNKFGVPTLVAEMGVGLRIDTEHCRQVIDGVFNLMKEIGVWQGEVEPVRTPIISREGDCLTLRCEVTGVFISKIKGFGKIGVGELIGIIIKPITGEILQEIISPYDGFLFSLREHPVVYPGDIIARVHGGKHE